VRHHAFLGPQRFPDRAGKACYWLGFRWARCLWCWRDERCASDATALSNALGVFRTAYSDNYKLSTASLTSFTKGSLARTLTSIVAVIGFAFSDEPSCSPSPIKKAPEHLGGDGRYLVQQTWPMEWAACVLTVSRIRSKTAHNSGFNFCGLPQRNGFDSQKDISSV